MAWCGAEATFIFDNERRYREVKEFLEKISKAHVGGHELPRGFSDTVTDFYFIEVQDRDAFQKFMGAGKN